MKRNLILSCLVTLILALVISDLAKAQTGGGYDLTWGTVAGGGATDSASAGGFTLGDTIGQVNAGTAVGGKYTLTSGLWSTIANVATAYHVFLPVLLNNASNGRP